MTKILKVFLGIRSCKFLNKHFLIEMGIESRIIYMLPITASLLRKDIEEKRADIKSISQQGAEIWEGDQWHSTTYREQQRQKELAIRLLGQIDTGNQTEILSQPTQTDIIEIGHMAQVTLPDDEVFIEAGIPWSLVHVLTTVDARYLNPLFDNLREIVISNESPLGKALIGQKRGCITTYGTNQRLQVLNTPEAIVVSSLFNLITQL